jgi:hypothetical protein
MLNFDYYGIPLTHQKIVPGNTATALSAYCYKYKLYRLNFDDADTEIHVGDWVVGASSGAVAKVRYITSTAWTNGVGYALIDSWNGIAWTNNEEIKAAADATCANVDQAAAIVEASDAEYLLAAVKQYKDLVARFALVTCTAQTALANIDGGIPDQTALVGIPLWANSSFPIHDASGIAAFKVIDYTAGSASTIQVEFFF